MLVVKIFRDNAENFKGITVANEWEEIARQIRIYFSDPKKVRQRINNGEVVNLPYFSLQKDRRVRDIKVTEEQRRLVQV